MSCDTHSVTHVLVPKGVKCELHMKYLEYLERPTTFILYLGRLFATIPASFGGRTGVREPRTPKGIEPTCYSTTHTCNTKLGQACVQASCPAPCYSHARAPSSSVGELWHLHSRVLVWHWGCTSPKGMKTTSHIRMSEEPEVEPSPHSIPSPSESPVRDLKPLDGLSKPSPSLRALFQSEFAPKISNLPMDGHHMFTKVNIVLPLSNIPVIFLLENLLTKLKPKPLKPKLNPTVSLGRDRDPRGAQHGARAHPRLGQDRHGKQQ